MSTFLGIIAGLTIGTITGGTIVSFMAIDKKPLRDFFEAMAADKTENN